MADSPSLIPPMRLVAGRLFQAGCRSVSSVPGTGLPLVCLVRVGRLLPAGRPHWTRLQAGRRAGHHDYCAVLSACRPGGRGLAACHGSCCEVRLQIVCKIWTGLGAAVTRFNDLWQCHRVDCNPVADPSPWDAACPFTVPVVAFGLVWLPGRPHLTAVGFEATTHRGLSGAVGCSVPYRVLQSTLQSLLSTLSPVTRGS